MTRRVLNRRVLINVACTVVGLAALAVLLATGTLATIDWIGRP